MGMVEQFAGLWSSLAGLLLIWSMLRPYIPIQLFERFAGRFLRRRFAQLMDPYLTITVAEYDSERMKRGEAYGQAKAYLSHRCAHRARSLRAEHAYDGDRVVLSLGDNEEVDDEFHGATVWWHAVPASRRGYQMGAPWYGGGGEAGTEDVGRAYRLVFHERHRDLIVDSYLPQVCREGRAIIAANRQRKLYTNSGERYVESLWSYVLLEHPSTFDTLAMDPAKKREIMDDLDAFRKGKDYYARIGKAWKRGYLLYGPPGTGKSTMIAAMANYLDYDIYDVELTSVFTNTDLRRMFIQTEAKSIIVIEDIDCSLNLTGKRNKKQLADDADPADPNASNVTLSGLLNFIDGLWSVCGSERIIVFTTNHIERLDTALIRSGRMDMHIEMSYCSFQSFKFLANNYLSIDTHPLFDDINALLQEVNITPADVTELLTPKHANDDADSCLAGVVKALNKAKEKKPPKNAHEEEETV